MTEQILRASLHQALSLDKGLNEWFMTRVNLSHKAKARFYDVCKLTQWGYAPESSDMMAMVDNRGEPIALHLCPMLRDLHTGLGLKASERAARMLDEQAPAPHASSRVVLIAPASLVRQQWHAAREFPYWIDFDALTKRQLGDTAA